MPRGRSRLIAIQALIVGAVALAVTFTLLRPEDDEPLFGISTPEPSERAVPEYDPGDRARDRARRERGRRARAGDLAPTGATAIAGGDAFAGAGAGGPLTSPMAPVSNDGADYASPADDQYEDTLARLNARLR